MYELVNISNYFSDLKHFDNNALKMESFLHRHGLDGFEVMFCAPWERKSLPPHLVRGVHLRYWPIWLDFWRGDKAALLEQFGSEENIMKYYGGLNREALIRTYRENIATAVEAGAEYVVFHVSHAREAEIFTWNFSASDREVIEAAIDLVNIIMQDVPSNIAILFENLWWPGLTLKDLAMVELLFSGIKHPNKGIMLDVGHLLNTNQELTTEQQAVEYVLHILKGLGSYIELVRGMHLHYSLSGEYVKTSHRGNAPEVTINELISHVLKIDEHRPFTYPGVKSIVDFTKPDYLVHEFIYSTLPELSEKVTIQKKALGTAIGGYKYGISKA